MKRPEVPLSRKLHYLSLALTNDLEYSKSPRSKTDIIGYACQYSSHPKLKREDFRELVSMNIGDLLKKVGADYKF